MLAEAFYKLLKIIQKISRKPGSHLQQHLWIKECLALAQLGVKFECCLISLLIAAVGCSASSVVRDGLDSSTREGSSVVFIVLPRGRQAWRLANR